LLRQVTDARLDLAGHVDHRAREQAELASGVRGWWHVVVALRELLRGAGHRLQRARDRADEDPRQQQAPEKAEPRADEQPVAHARAGLEHVAERHGEPVDAPEIRRHRHQGLRWLVVTQLTARATDLAAARPRDLVGLADRPADHGLLRASRLARARRRRRS
jgi:hypothetical protein